MKRLSIISAAVAAFVTPLAANASAPQASVSQSACIEVVIILSDGEAVDALLCFRTPEGL